MENRDVSVHLEHKVRPDIVIQGTDAVTLFGEEEIGLDHLASLRETTRAVADSTNISNR